VRIVKEPDVRKNEILDAAEKLFTVKGYELATVNDILSAVKIAKGTFYYYYKSKEDVLDALVERHVSFRVDKAENIINSALPVVQKLLAVILAQKPQNEDQKNFNLVLHEKENSKMHEKSLTQSILRICPCLAKVIIEGNETGIFNAPFPLESAEILLAAAIVIFDDSLFNWTNAETTTKIAAFLNAMECCLGAQKGTFSEFAELFN